MNGPPHPPPPPPGYTQADIEAQKAAHLRKRKAAQVAHYKAARDIAPDIYVTATQYPGGVVVKSWAVVEESRSGDSA